MGSETLSLTRVKRLWEAWDVRILMLISLLIQFLLTFLAPQRKRWGSGIFKGIMWFLYLIADAVALYTIGLISSSSQEDLKAFWAPFLLLHLGGPDTITALALEDNELWHRHALQLVTQVATTIYVFSWSFSSKHSDRLLCWLSVLIFIDGFIKYIERTFALYFASMENFREKQRSNPEAGPNYARLMEEYSSAAASHIPTEIKGQDGSSRFQGRVANASRQLTQQQLRVEVDTEEEAMVRTAYQFYDKFKCLLADSFLSLKDRDGSRDVFLRKSPQEAFKIVEIELNFIYDVFYTKVFLLRRKRSVARIFCVPSVMVSLLLFSFKDKKDYEGIDVAITYALLGGAIALDVVATLMFLFSDWWIIVASWSSRSNFLASHIMWLRRSSGRFLRFSRWSQSMSQYNLLNRCLEGSRFFNYIYIKKIKDFFIGWLCVESSEVDKDLENFIVQELQQKSRLATDIEGIQNICSARGTLVSQDDYLLVSECLRPWTVDVDYDESLLIWHLATDLCYQTSPDPEKVYKHNKYCKFSKQLSDYMSYLVLMQQALVSSVVGASDIRFEDTREEAKKFIQNSLLLQTSPSDRKLFCEKVLEVKAEVQPIKAKGDKSKSVLFDACRLAKQLKMFKEEQWKIMSKVWVELLAYAAIRCSPRSHVAQLSQGGELITIVWLLMAHLGVGERFRRNQGFGLTKLIIHK